MTNTTRGGADLDLTIAGPFALIPVSLSKLLYSSNDFKQLVFAIYIDSKRRCKGGKWDFNTADIAHETAIDRRLVSGLCKSFQEAGIFSATGRTLKGSRKYQLNHRKFERYLNGKLKLKNSKVVCMECTAPDAHQPDQNPIESGTSLKTPEADFGNRCASDASLVSMPCSFGVHPMHTKISEKISEEDGNVTKIPFIKPNQVRLTASKEELKDLLKQSKSIGSTARKEATPAPSTILN